MFAWDFENRLMQVSTPSSGSVTYKYDALGRRIQRAPSVGASTNFIYDGQDVVQDLNSDATTVDYLNGPGIDNKISQTSTSGRKATTLYYLADHLGSTTALTNKQGHLLEQISYDSYGNSTGRASTRYDYTGRERDSLTGLLHYRARWYDPQLGRFISEDPIGLAGGINSFAYVRNNPARFSDPSGLCPQNSGPHEPLHFLKTPNPCLDGIVAATPAVARRSARANLPLVLQAAEEANLTASQAAYVLASAYHESQLGRLMTEIWGPTHAQSKYEGSARLGNTLAGDGKGYLGRGFVQITGRKHYQEWSDLLGYDLVGDPSLATDPQIAAQILVSGMQGGLFTGKALEDFINDEGTDFYHARSIVNGDMGTNGRRIAGYAQGYLTALENCGWRRRLWY